MSAHAVHRGIGLALEGARRASVPLRPGPDWIIIGAQKGGTSSLFSWLAAHPDVAATRRKETDYFAWNFARGHSWYRSQFPLGTRGHRRRGEASPNYLAHPLAAERVRADAPAAKLIVLLRDPVERAVSHHGHSRRSGFESLDLYDALRAESDRLAGEEERVIAEPSYDSTALRKFSYAYRGCYADRLAPWLRDSSTKVLVVRSESLFEAPAAVYRSVLAFLELDPWEPLAWPARNQRAVEPTPDQRASDFLRERLGAQVDRLRRDFGVLFDWSSFPLAVHDRDVTGGDVVVIDGRHMQW